MLNFATKRNSAATAFLVTSAIWFVVGTVYGMFSAIHLAAPEAFDNVAALVFGRTRPVHVNTLIFGFASQMLVGAALYYVPQLLKTDLWSERLGWLSWALWNVTVLSGPIGFAFARSQGREYAEYTWTFDVLLTAAVLLLVVNVVMTIARRRENPIYVSVWYVAGSVVWLAMVYPIGNVMWEAPLGAMPGLIDSVFLWFYGHNLVGLLLTPFAIAAAYYILPRLTRTPLYSHTLSLVGFWSLIALYSHIGGHHILQAPIPNWLKVVSVVDSVMMIIPVFVVLGNLWLTARGRFGAVWRDPAGRFVITGTIWYLIVCIQGPLHSLPSVQEVTHFNNWVVGHAHIAVLGFSGFIALGAMWHVLPNLCGRRLYSPRLVNLQFTLAMIGLVGFFVVLTAAGLLQGEQWYNGIAFYRVLPQLSAYMILRAALGVFIFSSAVVGLVNLVLTLTRGEPIAARGAGSLPDGSPQPAGAPQTSVQPAGAQPKEGRP